MNVARPPIRPVSGGIRPVIPIIPGQSVQPTQVVQTVQVVQTNPIVPVVSGQFAQPTQVVLPVVRPMLTRPIITPVVPSTQQPQPTQQIVPTVPPIQETVSVVPSTQPTQPIQQIRPVIRPVVQTQPSITPTTQQTQVPPSIPKPTIVPVTQIAQAVQISRPVIVPIQPSQTTKPRQIVKPATQPTQPAQPLPAPQITLMDIDANMSTILQLIQSEPCLQIVAPTGSGKSLAVPRAIARINFGDNTRDIKCSVVVPTRTAALTLTERQRELYKQEHPEVTPKQLESLIGYAADRVIKYGSLITYMTAGHARRKLLGYYQNGQVYAIDFTNVLIIDEYHTATTDLTIIQTLLNLASQARVLTPIPIFMSATATGLPFNCATYTMPLGNRFTITYVYQNRSYSLGQLDQLYKDTAKVIIQYHTTTDVTSGHILVFAAGSSEIDKITEGLSSIAANKDVVILPAYGALSSADLQRIYTNYGATRRKIILATNIGESAITISDIGYVIDTMYEKRRETSNSGSKRLKLHLESKDSAIQRAGRTGRTRPGICHRMISQIDYEKLDQHRSAEISRVPIYDVILELLSSGIDPLLIPELSPVRVNQATQQLTKLGMIVKESGRYLVTDLGAFVSNIPLSVQNAAFLYEWLKVSEYAYLGIILSVLIDSYGPSYLYLPKKGPQESSIIFKQRLEEHKKKYFAGIIGYSELATMVNMWIKLVDDLSGNLSGRLARREKKLARWASQNSIRLDKIQEVIKIWQQITPIISDLGYNTEIVRFTTEGLLNIARPILSGIYSDSIFTHASELNYRRGKLVYRLDAKNGVNTLISKPAKTIIGLMTREIVTGQRTNRLIDLYVDLPVVQKEPVTSLTNKIYQILVPKELRPKYPNLANVLTETINLESLYDIYQHRSPSISKKWSGPNPNRLTSAQQALESLRPLLKYVPRQPDLSGYQVTYQTDYVYQNPWNILPTGQTAILDFGSGDGTKGYVFGEMTGYPILYSDIEDQRIPPANTAEFLPYSYDQPLDLPARYMISASVFHLLHHIPTDIEVKNRLRDLHRVIMDDGVLFIREHDVDSDSLARELDYLHLAYEINEVRTGMSFAEFTQWLTNRVRLNLHDREGWTKLMRESGFQLLDFTSVTGAGKDYFAVYLKISESTQNIAENMLSLLTENGI